jgi:3-dehydrosphinganine reductase
MVERGRGSVVAVSSAAGLIGGFGCSDYGPAKFAVRGPGAVTREVARM